MGGQTYAKCSVPARVASVGVRVSYADPTNAVRAARPNIMWRKRFVWRVACSACIVDHMSGVARWASSPTEQQHSFSAVRHDPDVDLFGDPDGVSQRALGEVPAGARARSGRNGDRVPGARPGQRPTRRAQGAQSGARGDAGRRTFPARDRGRSHPPAPEHRRRHRFGRGEWAAVSTRCPSSREHRCATSWIARSSCRSTKRST